MQPGHTTGTLAVVVENQSAGGTREDLDVRGPFRVGFRIRLPALLVTASLAGRAECRIARRGDKESPASVDTWG
jgi:hypothetical protein